MAWLCWDLDGTLIEQVPQPDGSSALQPVEGAVETAHRYTSEGHRLTVYTSRFAPMPESERNRVKGEIESHLTQLGFPPMEVWTGTTKPACDLLISKDAVTYDGDYSLVQAQIDLMLEERGLLPQAVPGEGLGAEGVEPNQGAQAPQTQGEMP